MVLTELHGRNEPGAWEGVEGALVQNVEDDVERIPAGRDKAQYASTHMWHAVGKARRGAGLAPQHGASKRPACWSAAVLRAHPNLGLLGVTPAQLLCLRDYLEWLTDCSKEHIATIYTVCLPMQDSPLLP